MEMSRTIGEELCLLAQSAALGLFLMAAYDGLRLFRFFVPHGVWWTGMEDAAYWLASGVLTFLLLLAQNDGIWRWYATAGVFVGMLFWNFMVSRIFMKLLKKAQKYFTIKDIHKKNRMRRADGRREATADGGRTGERTRTEKKAGKPE